MSGHSHDHARHVLVTARQSNACIMMLCARDCLDTVCDNLSGLKRKTHSCKCQQQLGAASFRPLPSPPIVIASETPIVLYCHANIPSLWTEFLTVLPRSSTRIDAQFLETIEHIRRLLRVSREEAYDAYWVRVSATANDHRAGSLTCMDCPPTRLMPRQHAGYSSLNLGQVHLQHTASPIGR